MIEIDFNKKIAENYIIKKYDKVQYAVGYTIDEIARGVIRMNKNFLLSKQFDFRNKSFKSYVGNAMWHLPRGARGIRDSNLKTTLFFHNEKISDYFSLHEEGGVKYRRLVPFGATKSGRFVRKKVYAHLTGQSIESSLKFSNDMIAKSGKLVKLKTGIFVRQNRRLSPLFTFHSVTKYNKTYRFEEMAKIHVVRVMPRILRRYMGMVNRG